MTNIHKPGRALPFASPTPPKPPLSGIFEAFRSRWPEYAMEAALLGSFIASACLFGIVLEYPGSPVRALLTSATLRRLLMGIVMGLTALGIFYSPWGKQSGAHVNPAVTLTFLYLGKIRRVDASFYVIAQFAGAAVSVALLATLLRKELSDPSVKFVTTTPGAYGTLVALVSELFISFVMMSVVLYANNDDKLHKYTGVLAAILVFLFISIESPLSGMSMNAARTFGSAFSAHIWTGYWIYLIAPIGGMLGAATLHLALRGQASVRCAKLHHDNDRRCIHCGANGGFPSVRSL